MFPRWWSVSVVELLYVAEKSSTHWLFLKYFTELVGHLKKNNLNFTKECGDFKKLQIHLKCGGMFWLSHSLCDPHKGWKRELQVEAEVLVFLFFCLKQVDQNLTEDSYNCLRLLESALCSVKSLLRPPPKNLIAFIFQPNTVEWLFSYSVI